MTVAASCDPTVFAGFPFGHSAIALASVAVRAKHLQVVGRIGASPRARYPVIDLHHLEREVFAAGPSSVGHGLARLHRTGAGRPAVRAMTLSAPSLLLEPPLGHSVIGEVLEQLKDCRARPVVPAESLHAHVYALRSLIFLVLFFSWLVIDHGHGRVPPHSWVKNDLNSRNHGS